MPRSNSKQFSTRASILLEALLSILVMAVGLTAIMQSLTTGYRAALINKDYLQAIFLAEDQMAMIVFEGMADAASSEKFPAPNERFEYDVAVGPSKVSDMDELQEVNFKISWLTGSQQNELPVTTFLFHLADENK